MTAMHRAFLRDLGLLIGLPLFLAVLGVGAMLLWWRPWPSYEVPDGTEFASVVEGTWDWTTAPADSFCIADRHTIRFSADRKVMSIAQLNSWTDSAGATHRVSIYDLTEWSQGHVRGQIRGESRLTLLGRPVVWDLRLTSPDTYHWERTDWPPMGATAEVRRCPPGTLPAPDEASSS